MKQLAEREPQQSEDDGDGMNDSEKIVRVSLHPGVARCQQQPRHADREQQYQRQEVGDLLHGDRAVIVEKTAGPAEFVAGLGL